jgi:hypothetical protein
LRAQRLTRFPLAAGLALIALAIAATLSSSPVVVAGANSIQARSEIAGTRGETRICQGNEVLPRDVTAIRLWMIANNGPRVSVEALAGGRVLTRGEREAGWGIDATVTIPVRSMSRAVQDATVCVTLGAAVEPVYLFGGPIGGAASKKGGTAEMRIEYLQASGGSWWSEIPTVARRIGLGRAPSGTWVALLALALMVAVVALTSWALLRAQRFGPSAAGWSCALIACLSATSWSILTPPFQARDEPSHFAYVQTLAETGRLPSSGEGSFAPAEEVVLRDIRDFEVRWQPQVKTISSLAQQRRLQADLSLPYDRRGQGNAGVAGTEPPLYYALEAIPYELGSGGTLLDQLTLMRLLSSLLAGLTALFAFLFVREALPGAPWAWIVGGLGVALMPLLGFMSGSVNPEAMLYTVAAALFYCLARGFRGGLTPGLAVTIGALTAVGFLTKLNFAGLAPGTILGLVLLTRRTARSSRRVAYRSLAIALAIATSPVYIYALVNLISSRPGLGFTSGVISLTARRGDILDEIDYIWQFYLPRLPGMTNYFPGISTPRQIWFNHSVGLYGQLDTAFPVWVERFALLSAGLVTALVLRGILSSHAGLRRRLVELAVYSVMGAGAMILVGADSYLEFVTKSIVGYADPRYLLPMLPLMGAALALATRGAGRRWGPAAGMLIVLLILAHDIFSQLLVISRYYG